MMFRGMSSGASLMPSTNPMGNPTPMGQNVGSPMPPPQYNSFGSPALNAIRAEHHQLPQRTASNPSLANNPLLPMNSMVPPSADSGFGGAAGTPNSALFNTLQLKDVSAILQDGRSFIISLLLQVIT